MGSLPVELGDDALGGLGEDFSAERLTSVTTTVMTATMPLTTVQKATA